LLNSEGFFDYFRYLIEGGGRGIFILSQILPLQKKGGALRRPIHKKNYSLL